MFNDELISGYKRFILDCLHKQSPCSLGDISDAALSHYSDLNDVVLAIALVYLVEDNELTVISLPEETIKYALPAIGEGH